MWLRDQLREDSDRKFIIGCHVYSGARYNSYKMWNDEATNVYVGLVEEFRDRIIVELAGHDHFASLRTHKRGEGDYFHNLFVAPSITAWYDNNPGVSSFSINSELEAVKLRSTFLNLKPTIGHKKSLPLN